MCVQSIGKFNENKKIHHNLWFSILLLISRYEEIKDFDFNTKSGRGTGHFTQVVWKKSMKLGCGFGTRKNGDMHKEYVVCRYMDAGNFRGEYESNVGDLVNGEAKNRDTIAEPSVVTATALKRHIHSKKHSKKHAWWFLICFLIHACIFVMLRDFYLLFLHFWNTCFDLSWLLFFSCCFSSGGLKLEPVSFINASLFKYYGGAEGRINSSNLDAHSY